MKNPPEILLVPPGTTQVACNGNGGGGHPKVYYTLQGKDEVTCGYCDRLFSKKQIPGAKPLKGVA